MSQVLPGPALHAARPAAGDAPPAPAGATPPALPVARTLALLLLACLLPAWLAVWALADDALHREAAARQHHAPDEAHALRELPETAPGGLPPPAGDGVAEPAAGEAAPQASGRPGWRPGLQPLLAAVGLALAASAAAAAWLLRDVLRASRALVQAAAGHAAVLRLLQRRTQERDDALRARCEALREARRDPLTRLANRTAFLQRLQACVRARRERGGPLVVLFIDLDDFKAVNDRWGHALGDALLCAFATRLVGGVREGDLPARLSGDEFALLLDGLSLAEVEPIAQALLDRLSQPYGLGPRSVQVTASIGMAAFPAHATDAATLLEAADAAMYAAKAAGKGACRRYGWATPTPWGPAPQPHAPQRTREDP